MPSLYKSADCFVLPSRGEGWGRPQVEAMAMGLPLIGTTFWLRLLLVVVVVDVVCNFCCLLLLLLWSFLLLCSCHSILGPCVCCDHRGF